MIHLGDRLGLYRALAGGRAGDRRSTLAERDRARRALGARVAAGHGRGRAARDRRRRARSTLPPEARAVLVDEDAAWPSRPARSPAARPPATSTGWPRRSAPASASDYDAPRRRAAPTAPSGCSARGPARRWCPSILPALDGVVAKLEAGGRVARPRLRRRRGDGGARRGVPDGRRSHGVDLSRHAVERAEAAPGRRCANADVQLGRAEEVTEAGAYDLVLTFDCLHDMTRPADAIAAIRAGDRRPTARGWSRRSAAGRRGSRTAATRCWRCCTGSRSSACMSSATSRAGRRRPRHASGSPASCSSRWPGDAGFTRFTVHDFEDPANLYYEIRP